MRVFATSRISENMFETPEGYLVCVGVPVARTGEQLYGKDEVPLDSDENGHVVINREASEVFKSSTMASFEAKPFTIGHPTDFVGPQNWNKLAKGFARNIRRGSGEFEGSLLADLVVTSEDAIKLIKSGKREISCGYETEYVQTGIGRGVQKNIIGNHIALVDEGRAGSTYAINDHKGKGIEMTIKEKIKAIFAKAQDEALKVAGDELEEDEEETSTKATDSALLKAINTLSAKVDALGKKSKVKDSDEPPAVEKKEKKKGEDEEVAPSIEDRMTKLEAAVAGLVEKLSAKAADDDVDVEMGDSDEEESKESKADDEDESEAEASDEDCEDDDDFEESTMTGDTASRIEILAPGMDAKCKNPKAKALKVAYETKDGKAVINKLTGGRAPDLKDEKKVNTIFVAASEMLKATRNSGLARTKTGDEFNSFYDAPEGAMTPEKLNEINAKHFKTAH